MVTVAASCPKKWNPLSAIIKFYQGGTNYSHVLIIKDSEVYHCTRQGANHLELENFLCHNTLVWSMEIEDSMIDWDFVNSSISNKVKYSFFQIFAIATKYLTHIIFREGEAKRLICSEFVGKALKLDWVDDFTDPEDIVTYLKRMKSL